MRAVLVALAMVVNGAAQARPFHSRSHSIAEMVLGFVILGVFVVVGGVAWMGLDAAWRAVRKRLGR